MVSQKTFFVVVFMLWSGAWAQSSSSCNNVLISMSPCINYITGNSSTPSSGCCSQFANVVRTQPQCLCQVISGIVVSSFGINVNQTQALALPKACNVQTPPASQCNGAAAPTNSPAETTDSPTTPSGTGSKTVPSTESGISNGSSTKMTLSLLFSLLFIASYASATSIF